jgi:SAM-dependent methyltransferase
MTERYDEAYWEERYRSSHGGQHGPSGRPSQPNAQLVAEVAGLAPGRALDAGCGPGAEAIWLAAQGWQVTAVDISATALEQARERALAEGDAVAGRIDWVRADLTSWEPPAESFDLVASHYVHVAGALEVFLDRIAGAVAPGGTLVVVGHHPSEHDTTGARHGAHAHVTADVVTARLDPSAWEVLVAEARLHRAPRPDGREVTFHDAVVRAVRRG